MIKSLGEFLLVGLGVVVSYVVYFFAMLGATLIFGFPIALGIKLLVEAIRILFGTPI